MHLPFFRTYLNASLYLSCFLSLCVFVFSSPSQRQDRKDLDFALQVPGGVDVVALSFVQKPGDVQELKDIVQGRCRVMAKIEKPQAVNDLEEIVALCDAIMVARYDFLVSNEFVFHADYEF